MVIQKNENPDVVEEDYRPNIGPSLKKINTTHQSTSNQ